MDSRPRSMRKQRLDLKEVVAAAGLGEKANRVTVWLTREGYGDPSSWADMEKEMETLALQELRKEAELSFVALARLQSALHGKLRNEGIEAPPPISAMFWVNGMVVSLASFAGPIVLASLTWNETGDQYYSPKLWYYAWGPMIFIIMVEIACANLLAPRIGWDMISEASEEADLREAMKNSLSTQALVAALFLTVVWAMLQVDPIQDDTTLIISQWYQGLLCEAVALILIGTIDAIICLLYIEPLNPSAAKKLVYDNFMYFGEPLSLCLFGFYNAMTAMILYAFGNYGYGCGIVAVFGSGYCMLRILVIFQYMSAWQNKEIDHLRTERNELKNKVANVGTSVDLEVTRKRTASRPHVTGHV